ncbi:efflux RND transporter permease subunit [Escherichia coli]
MQEVFKTLVEATTSSSWSCICLQNFRATIIPTIAVPVVILGTFAIVGGRFHHQHVNSCSDGAGDNNELVDDAIVVVENVSVLITAEA